MNTCDDISPYLEVVLLAFYINKLRNEHTLSNPEQAYGIARKNIKNDRSILLSLKEEYKQVKSSSNASQSTRDEQQLQSKIESAFVDDDRKSEHRAPTNKFILDAMNMQDDDTFDDFHDDDDESDAKRPAQSIARAQRANNKYNDGDDSNQEDHHDDEDDHHI